ncbi:MAG: AAA family ATPase [Chloroflexota bacterium]
MNTNVKLKVLVLRDPGFRMDDDVTVGEVTTILEEQPNLKVAEGAAGYGEATRTVQRSEADLIIIDEVAGDPAAVVEQVDHVAPETPIIVVLGDEYRNAAQACILAGARAYLYRPFEPQELLDVLTRIYEKEDRRKKDRTARSPLQSGRIVVVHGPKGGVGTTTLAVNLAVAAHQITGRRVALVDANLMGGDVGVALNIASDNSIADVVAHLRELDGDLLEDTMVHHVSGVDVLPSPAALERAEAISGEETNRVLAACRQHFDIVVVDTAARLDEHVLASLDLADLILAVCTPEIASLKNTARFLRLGHDLGFGGDKIRLVINRLNSPGAITIADIEENLRYKMAYGIASDGVPIIHSLNAGEPVVLMRPRARASREIRGLASMVATQLGLRDAGGKTAPGADSIKGLWSKFARLSEAAPKAAAAH